MVLTGVEPRSGSRWVEMWVTQSKSLNSKSFYFCLLALGDISGEVVHIDVHQKLITWGAISKMVFGLTKT